MEKEYFQDFMPGNVCFGCGANNPNGLQIKSFWEGNEAVCIWDSEAKFLKPTPNIKALELRTQVKQIKGRKVVMDCQVFSEGVKTAEAEVIAIRVSEGKPEVDNPFVS